MDDNELRLLRNVPALIHIRRVIGRRRSIHIW